jgi:hypothetical protein
VSLDPDCFMCTGEWCLRCSPVGDHCEHDFMDRHIDTDGEFRCDDPPKEKGHE